MKRLLAGCGLAILLAGLAAGQTNPPKFEAADVHVSPPTTKEMDGGFIPGGRLELHGATMLDLISTFYEVEPDKVIGGPPWLNTNRYDMIAKAPAGASEETLQAMVKALVADRFQLQVHEDKREMPVYILTVSKKGPKLPPAADKEAQPKASRGQGDPALNNHVKYSSCTMAALATMLNQQARNFVIHPVVDETKLPGAYDFQLDWMGINIYRAAKANPDGPPAVGIVEALEKVGLHLEEGKRPQPVLVVDHVNEAPTPNAEGVTAKIPTFPTEFEVAEVRPAKSTAPPPGQTAPLGPMGTMRMDNGRIEILGATLKGLIPYAFNVDARFLVGAPKWLDEDRFDIIAKTLPNLPDDAVLGMLKQLLVERFQIKAHNEEQPMPVYVLEAGKNPKLKPANSASRSECNIVQRDKRYFVCTNTTMAQFAERLPTRAAAYVHPPLLDLTGLTGAYDFELYWTPKSLLQNTAGRGADAQASTPVVEVTVFEAVDKQLGLKLEEQKHPVPVTVLDSLLRTPAEK